HIVQINKTDKKIKKNRPIILSIGKTVDKIKYEKMSKTIIINAIFSFSKTCNKEAGVVTKTVPTKSNNKSAKKFTKCLETFPKNLPASSGIWAPLFRIEIIPGK